MNQVSSPTQIAILSFAHTSHACSYASALEKIPNARLAAIYDDNPQRGRFYAEKFRTPYYDNLETMLRHENLHGVIICSPTNQHLELTKVVTAHRLPILCEKPLATSITDAQEMITTCAQAEVLLQTAFVCRFAPIVQAARRLIQSGEVGRVLGIVGGNRGRPPLPPTYPEWITDPAFSGGGALLDHSVHVTDSIRFILGSEVDRVFAQSGHLFQKNLQVEDSALLSLVFQDGVMATVDPSWSVPENNPFHYDFYLRILCEKGTLQLDDTRQSLQVISDNREARPVVLEPFGLDIDRELVRHFVKCIVAGENLFPAACGKDGLRALEIALAGYDSIQIGQPVQLKLNS